MTKLTQKERKFLDTLAADLLQALGKDKYSQILANAKEKADLRVSATSEPVKCGYGPYCRMLCHLNIMCTVRPVCQV